MRYDYRIPLTDEGKPKYNVDQVKGEVITWRPKDGASLYTTNVRHPELEALPDVELVIVADKPKPKFVPKPKEPEEDEEEEEEEEKPKRGRGKGKSKK